MKDSRIPLANSTILRNPNKNEEYVICSELGRGGSCIVYDGTRDDVLKVRIKEFYPADSFHVRSTEQALVFPKENEGSFQTKLEAFEETYKGNVKLRQIPELTNSIVSVWDSFRQNGTSYIISNYDEGENYEKYKDNSLKELLEHLRSITEVIARFHENDYLYLDIKPDNILILPETTEIIKLFDFGSSVHMNDLDSIRSISYSCGFSAPEQMKGQRDKIGRHTDLFALGALLFYKLFGRTSTVMDCRIHASFDFAASPYYDDKLPPKLFRGLDKLLHKTMTTSTFARWQDAEELIQCLEELIPLSDLNQILLCDSLPHHNANFVGRLEEMEEINAVFSKETLLFLSGFGGIGKTELAKQYAHRYREKFNRIVFLRFHGSLVETFTDGELTIHNFECDVAETSEDYFKRILKTLKKICQEDDLFIIDNFNVLEDDKLMALLECPCSFLFTTREDFKEYRFPQQVVECMSYDDIYEVFCTYNDIDYNAKQSKAIYDMIGIMQCHTMLTELLAKHLKVSGENPCELLECIRTQKGVTSMTDYKVALQKEESLRFSSVEDHLAILFDAACLSPVELEIMRSLSLLGAVSINKKFFKKLCEGLFDKKAGKEAFSNLIQKGWIQSEQDKISLHQIVLDLIYNRKNPTAENCPHLLVGMKRYISLKFNFGFQKDSQIMLAKKFMDRLTGQSPDYIEYVLFYCQNIMCEAQNLKKVDELLQRCTKVRTDLKYRTARQWVRFYTSDDYLEEHKSMKEALKSLRNLLSLSNVFFKDSGKCGIEYITLAQHMEVPIIRNTVYTISGMDEWLNYANKLMKQSVTLISQSELSPEEKSKWLLEISEFYRYNRLKATVRNNRYIDNKKAYKLYQLAESFSTIPDDKQWSYQVLDDKADPESEREWLLLIKNAKNMPTVRDRVDAVWAALDSVDTEEFLDKTSLKYWFKGFVFDRYINFGTMLPELYQMLAEQFVEVRCDISKKNQLQALQLIAKQTKRQTEFIQDYIKAETQKAIIFCDSSTCYSQKVLRCINAAEKVLKKSKMDDYYLQNLIQAAKVEYYKRLEPYPAIEEVSVSKEFAELVRNTDFYFLAEKDADSKPLEKQIKLWNEAVERTEFIDDTMALRCSQRLIDLLEQLFQRDGFEEFEVYIRKYSRHIRLLKDTDRLSIIAFDFYEKLCRYYCDLCPDSEGDYIKDARIYFGLQLQHIGNHLCNVKAEEEAMRWYAAAMIIYLDQEQNYQHLMALVPGIRGDSSILVKRLNTLADSGSCTLLGIQAVNSLITKIRVSMKHLELIEPYSDFSEKIQKLIQKDVSFK